MNRLLCILLIFLTSKSFAFEDLAERIRETKEEINEAETERRRILGSLYAINMRMKKISSDKGKLTDELLQSQDAVNTVASAINALDARIAKQRSSLKKRLRAIYKISGESYIGAVFSTRNAFEFDSTLRNLKIISDHDFQLIRSYRTSLTQLANQRKKLKSQVERLLLVEKRIKRQELLLAGEHKAKSVLAATIEKDTRKRMSEIRELRQNQTVADVEIERLLKPSIYEKRGALAAPVSAGKISRDFGLYIDERFNFKMSHKGWKVSVATKTTVVATDDGVVVFSGQLPVYGETIIIDHGDHYYSVYSNLNTLFASGGRKVTRNESIGDTISELYFEIRHFSEPENPSSWISAKSSLLTKQISTPAYVQPEKQQAKVEFIGVQGKEL